MVDTMLFSRCKPAQVEALQHEQRSVAKLALQAMGGGWLLRYPGAEDPCCDGFYAI